VRKTKFALKNVKKLKFNSFSNMKLVSNESIFPKYGKAFLLGGALITATLLFNKEESSSQDVDYKQLRTDLEDLIESAFKTNPMYDDGSYVTRKKEKKL
jgi:hypothetical protein